MIFCLGDVQTESKSPGYHRDYAVFNKDVSESEYEEILSSLSDIEVLPTKWIEEKDMTTEERKNVKIAKEIGGYLKIFTYEEAWANFWTTATKKQKDTILAVPGFDAAIFKGITGIEVDDDIEGVSADEITLNGIKYRKV